MRTPDLDVAAPSTARDSARILGARGRGPGLAALATLAIGCMELSGGREATCAYEMKAVAADERTPLGFSLAQLQQSVAGTHQTTLTWVNADPSVLETFPAPRETALTLSASTTGDARFLEARREGGGQERLLCLGRAEIDGEIRLVTADGGFDDAWPVVFEAQMAGPDGPRSSFQVDLLASPPRGTFRARWKDLQPGEQQTLRLQGQLGGPSPSGQVSITRLNNGKGEGSGTWAARWGAR